MNVSVVIPTYNEEERITKTLEALANQTVKPYEVIAVDNNSTDSTSQIASSYGAIIVKETRQGYVYALNTGLKSAQGEVIAVTDADTYPDLNWIESITKGFEKENTVGITGFIHVESNSTLIRVLSEKSYELFLRLNFLIGKPHLSGFNFAVRNSALQNVNGLDENFTMSPDVDLGIRLMKHGKVVLVPEMKVTNSTRRWKGKITTTLYEYAKGYVFAAWLRKPPPVTQTIVR